MPDIDKDRLSGAAVALAACAALVTLAAYIPALRNGFVNWDDPVYVYENLRIRSLDLGFLSWVLTAVVSGNWHPLTVFSHAVDYALWGLNPMGHHLTSIVLHALNTGLVAVLAFRLASRGRTPLKELAPGVLAAGAVAALLFGLHPLHVESVAWVSERKDVLSALFFLLSLLAYLRYASGVHGGSSRRFNYAASLVLFGLALMSKPMAVTLPVVLLIIDFCPLERLRLKVGRDVAGGRAWVLLEKTPFFALSAASAVVTLWAQHKGGALKSLDVIAFTERVAMAIRGYAFYLYKVLVPIRLAPIYPTPQARAFFNVWFFASLALLIAVTVFCIYTAVYSTKRRRVFLAAWLYFLITLLPVIGLVQVGMQAAADRYMYLPSIGPFMLAGLGAGWLAGRYDKKGLSAVAAVVIVVSALMGYATVRQTRVWKDSIKLWSHEIRLYSRRVPIAYLNRGSAYGKQGRHDRAMKDFETAIALRPGYAVAYIDRGVIHGMQGRYGQAIKDFDTAIDLAPENKKAYYNRANAYTLTGEYHRAIDDFTAAIKIDPEHPDAYNNRAVVYLKLGNWGQAIEDSKKAVELDPGMAGAYFNLGLAYLRLGDTSRAAENFDIASKLGSVEARDYLRNL